MSKKSVTSTRGSATQAPLLKKVTHKAGLTEYRLTSNDLRVLYAHRPHTGVITSDIVYLVGSRDEARGETGLAHMFEHMLFKPTSFDIQRKTDSGAMLFERETGAVLNANTWKDRTSYYFSYPKEHFERVLQIEAERMHNLVLTDKEFSPERTNVLSEFDMHAGDEQFALAVQMAGAAFESHPYGHETIGFREDIESYTIEKLKAFYEMYYAPNNAVLTIVGDISEKTMKELVLKQFATIPKSITLQPRLHIREPKQEGVRTVTVERASTTNLYALGVKHAGFPTKAWFETMVIFDMLAGGDDSILNKKLVDTGLASSIQTSLEPSREMNLGILFVTLTKKSSHAEMHDAVQKSINALTIKDITPYLKKTIAKTLTHEYMTRENSLGYVSELVEYISADAWEHFFDSVQILKSITPRDIQARIKLLFAPQQTTIGYFIGTNTTK
jgi:zinc protease